MVFKAPFFYLVVDPSFHLTLLNFERRFGKNVPLFRPWLNGLFTKSLKHNSYLIHNFSYFLLVQKTTKISFPNFSMQWENFQLKFISNNPNFVQTTKPNFPRNTKRQKIGSYLTNKETRKRNRQPNEIHKLSNSRWNTMENNTI